MAEVASVMNQFRLEAVLRIILRRIGRDFTSLR
jgi:hypothetical protein